MTSRHISLKLRNNFRRVMTQLDKTKSEKSILKIVAQAAAVLHEADVDWDTVTVRVPGEYVLRSERKKWKPVVLTTEVAAKVATALHPTANGSYPLGRDGRALLKTAVTRHPDWPLVSEQLGVDIAHVSVADLIAIAQLLKLDDRFIAMFTDTPVVTQAELPLNGDGNSGE